MTDVYGETVFKTVEDIEGAIANIKYYLDAGKPFTARRMSAELYEEVLRTIANGNPYAEHLAATVLKASKLLG